MSVNSLYNFMEKETLKNATIFLGPFREKLFRVSDSNELTYSNYSYIQLIILATW